MAEHIIDSFVSDEAKKQIAELASTISTLATSLEKLENVNKTITKKGGNNAEFNAIEEAKKRILKLEKELEVIRTTESNQIFQLQEQRKAEIAQKKENLGLISRIVKVKKEKVQATIEETIATKTSNEQEKLKATIGSQNVSMMEKLTAQIKVQSVELQKLMSEGKRGSEEYNQRRESISSLLAQKKALHNEINSITVAEKKLLL